jgi:Sporulation inhibitor A
MEVALPMGKLPDNLLIECYLKAKDLNLNPHFIYLLEAEIRARSLPVKNQAAVKIQVTG